MKWLWHSVLPLLLVACFASLVTACKSRAHELTGKWSGNSDLSTQMARAPGSLQMQNAKPVPVQVTMTLNQNGGGVTGDAAVVISGKPEIHLPITAGVVGQDGKVFHRGRSLWFQQCPPYLQWKRGSRSTLR